jgi:hypothetical protein
MGGKGACDLAFRFAGARLALDHTDKIEAFEVTHAIVWEVAGKVWKVWVREVWSGEEKCDPGEEHVLTVVSLQFLISSSGQTHQSSNSQEIKYGSFICRIPIIQRKILEFKE